MDEIWKPIEGYEGLYEVSNLGRVRSLTRTVVRSDGRSNRFNGQILKPVLNNKGYQRFRLSNNDHETRFFAHRLVGLAFVPNPDPEHLTVINHKDENPLNNRADNLEWCTQSYNASYGSAIKKRLDKCYKPVCGYTEIGEVVIRFDSLTEAERFGFKKSSISACCRGERESHRCLYWCFADEEDQIVPRKRPILHKRPVEAYIGGSPK